MKCEFLLPLKTVSLANQREHWSKRARRAKVERFVAAISMRQRLGSSPWPRGSATVTLSRIAPRALDSDNLTGSMKHVRDGIADALGVDDRDPRVTWEYAQEKPSKPKTYAVRVTVEFRAAERSA